MNFGRVLKSNFPEIWFRDSRKGSELTKPSCGGCVSLQWEELSLARFELLDILQIVNVKGGEMSILKYPQFHGL